MSTSIRQFIQSHGTDLTPSFEEHTEELDVVVPEVQDVKDEELYEAEDLLEEVEEERAEAKASVEMYENVEAEVNDIFASIENYMEVLELGIESGQFSPQFAAVAGTELTRLSSIYGDTVSVPALEDFNHDNLDQFYSQSLEGFGEVAGKMRATVVNAAKKTRDYLVSVGTNEKAAKALNTKADAMMAKLEGAEIDGKSIALKGLGKVFTHEGQVPSNLLSAIANDQKGLNVLATKHIQNTVSYYEDSLKAGAQALKEPGSSGSILETFAKKPTPNEQIAKSVNLLGAKVNVYVDSNNSKNTGAGVVANKAETLSDQHMLFDVQKKADGNITLDKTQVTGLIKAAKVYAGMLEVLNREAKKELARQTKLDKELISAASSQGSSADSSNKSFLRTFGSSLVGAGAGVAIGGGPIGAVVGAVAGANLPKRKHKDASGSDSDVAVREFGKVIKYASAMPVSHFKEVANVIEYHAKMCLQLADRAISGKAAKEETAEDKE